MGPFDPNQVQLHDVNPGDLNVPGQPNHFPDGGVFWTREVPNSSVSMRPGKGDAQFSVTDLGMLEFYDVVNTIFRNGAAPVDATGSVDIAWHGTGERTHIDNEELGFSGTYEGADMDVNWSINVPSDNYYFSTDGSSSSRITSAFTAHVHTGVFRP